ncbi:MAG: HAMP domain-containing sensor histidine kinase [Candidatus Krumholzibacteriota bacterium]
MTATLIPNAEKTVSRTTETGERQDRRLLVGYLHKTSNTLCGIKGYASLIADREAGAGQAGRWARKIIAEVERMEEIFRSVGDLTRGRQNPDVGVDLPGLVHDVAKEIARNGWGLDLQVGDIPAGELKLPVADLVLMLSEILNNCAESRASDSDRVSAAIHGERDRDGRVFLKVKDDGCGMDDGLLAQATSPFVTNKEGHHGVGLTRVDTLMEMYGLAWTLESQAGRGTNIRLEVAEGY